MDGLPAEPATSRLCGTGRGERRSPGTISNAELERLPGKFLGVLGALGVSDRLCVLFSDPFACASECDAYVHAEPDRRLVAAGGALPGQQRSAQVLRVLLESNRNDAFDKVRHWTRRESAIQERREAPR